MKFNLKSIIGISLGCLLLGFAGGFILGHKKTADVPEDQILYAIVEGQKIYGRDVRAQLGSALQDLEKNKYQSKKKAVLEYVLNRKETISKIQVDEKKLTAEAFSKFAKERNLKIEKMTAQQKADAFNNFRIHLESLQRRSAKQDAAENMQIDWYIPMTYLEAPIAVGEGVLPKLQEGKDARVVIFANYYCPYCPKAYAHLQKIKQKYDGKVQVDFRFSLMENKQSVVFRSALATFCANEQGKLNTFLNAAFEKPPMTEEALVELAQASRLESEKFVACMKAEKTEKELMKDLNEAIKMQLEGRALIYVNGHALEPQDSFENLEDLLRQK